jgi:hypothetical protein
VALSSRSTKFTSLLTEVEAAAACPALRPRSPSTGIATPWRVPRPGAVATGFAIAHIAERAGCPVEVAAAAINRPLTRGRSALELVCSGWFTLRRR